MLAQTIKPVTQEKVLGNVKMTMDMQYKSITNSDVSYKAVRREGNASLKNKGYLILQSNTTTSPRIVADTKKISTPVMGLQNINATEEMRNPKKKYLIFPGNLPSETVTKPQ